MGARRKACVSKYTLPLASYAKPLAMMRCTYATMTSMYSLTRVSTLGSRQPSTRMSARNSTSKRAACRLQRAARSLPAGKGSVEAQPACAKARA